LFVSYCSQIM